MGLEALRCLKTNGLASEEGDERVLAAPPGVGHSVHFEYRLVPAELKGLDCLAGDLRDGLGTATGMVGERQGFHPSVRAGTLTRHALTADLIAEIRIWDVKLKDNAKAMAALVTKSGSRLTDTPGIGAVTAARPLANPNPNLFPDRRCVRTVRRHRSHRDSQCGALTPPPLQAGDRRLNAALHTVAFTQIRIPGTQGHTYYRAKIAEGKTSREAQRCLKRRLANHVWRTTVADERRRT
ncbi:hypothetical protein MBT84_37480 [Streptomyces sp. MBT84]|nr:hypothetical protein [Streptomyces sp. MBT84]